MATIVEKFIQSSGGDYSSLSAFEAGEQADFVSGDVIKKATINEAFQDTAAVSFSGATTDGTRYWWVHVPDAYGHEGKYNSTKYRLEPTDAEALRIEDENFKQTGPFQINVQSPTAVRAEILPVFAASGAALCEFERLIIKGNGANSEGLGFGSATCHSVRLRNALIYNCTESFFGGCRFDGGTAGTTVTAYNCTMVGNYYGFRAQRTASMKLVNCIGDGNTSGGNFVLDAGSWITGTGYNASSTGTATGGTGDRVSQTFTYFDAAVDDYRLSRTDGGAHSFGTDLSADATYPVTNDISGKTRVANPWDIGASEAGHLLVDTISHATPVIGATGDISWSHTCSADANKLVIGFGTGASPTAGRRNVATVTYNGVPCTQIGEADDGNFEHTELWQLNNPPAGTFTIAATMVSTGSINDQTTAGAISFFNASEVTGAPSTNSANSTNPTVTVADSAAGDIVVSISASDTGNLATTTENGILMWEDEDVGSGDSDMNAQRQVATGANTVCGWTCSNANLWCAIGVAIKQWFQLPDVTPIRMTQSGLRW